MKERRRGVTATKKKARKHIVLRILISILFIWGFAVLVDMQMTLSERRQERDELLRQYELQRLDNKELERQIAAGLDEDYVERFARDYLGYVSPSERMFIDISGS